MSTFNYYPASVMFQADQDSVLVYGQPDSQLPEPAQEAREDLAEGAQLTDEEMADLLKSYDLLNVPQQVMIQKPENLIPVIQVDPQFRQPSQDPLCKYLSKELTDRLNLIPEMESKNDRLKEAKEVLEEKIAKAVDYQRDLDAIMFDLNSNQTSLDKNHSEIAVISTELEKIKNPPHLKNHKRKSHLNIQT